MIKRTILLLFTFSLLVNSFTLIHGEEYDGAEVGVSIESHDKTLARGKLNAYTFEDAIKKLAAENQIEIVSSQDGSISQIYSVNKIKNNLFASTDGWFGYILRNEQILSPDEYMGVPLEKGDQVVLYYGDSVKTKIISHFELNVVNNKATFSTASNLTKWFEKNDIWSKKLVKENLGDVKIHLYVPGDVQKILKTNNGGKVSVTLDKLGIYQYYAEGYEYNETPVVVRTQDFYYLYGIKDDKKVSRAEAVAFIVNHFNIEKSSGDRTIATQAFSDVTEETSHYKEIDTAVVAGLLSGYDDGTFRPDESINLLQFSIILSRIYENDAHVKSASKPIDGVPAYAQDSVEVVLNKNLLSHVNKNWTQPVTADILKQIYFNHM